MLASPAGAYFNEAERESGILFLFTNRHKTDGQEVVIDCGWRLVSVHQHLHASRGWGTNNTPSQVRVCQRCQITNDANCYPKWHDGKQS